MTNSTNMIMESYKMDKEYLYNKTYLFILGYATAKEFRYTLMALPLARRIHEGQFRHGTVDINGEKVHLPYIIHCLKVCSTLISLNLPLSNEELDILYTCALLHDTLEDGKSFFPNGKKDFSDTYGFPKEVGNIIQLLSKHQGSTPEELYTYFNNIKENKIALLVKLADRSHNVEDLYNIKNVQKYINETRMYFIDSGGLCSYAKTHYPELSNGVTILKAKILSLTEVTEIILDKKEKELMEKEEIIKKQQKEIEKLKLQLSKKE